MVRVVGPIWAKGYGDPCFTAQHVNETLVLTIEQVENGNKYTHTHIYIYPFGNEHTGGKFGRFGAHFFAKHAKQLTSRDPKLDIWAFTNPCSPSHDWPALIQFYMLTTVVSLICWDFLCV